MPVFSHWRSLTDGIDNGKASTALELPGRVSPRLGMPSSRGRMPCQYAKIGVRTGIPPVTHGPAPKAKRAVWIRSRFGAPKGARVEISRRSRTRRWCRREYGRAVSARNPWGPTGPSYFCYALRPLRSYRPLLGVAVSLDRPQERIKPWALRRAIFDDALQPPLVRSLPLLLLRRIVNGVLLLNRVLLTA